MVVSVTGIVINVLMALVIFFLVAIGLNFSTMLRICETKQSPFCYTIHCPCDDPGQGPCKGYAKQPAETPGQWYCSSAPLTAVDNAGNPVQ